MVDNSGVAHYQGLVTCGSIWACPVCGAKIRNARAEEIAAAAAVWHQAGNSVLMVTLTAPHDMGMMLECQACKGSGIKRGTSCACKGRRRRHRTIGKRTPDTCALRACPACGGRGGLLPVISRSFSAVIAGRAWLRLKETVPVAGTIRSLEVTHGPNGWHPHLHALVFIHGQVDAAQLAALSIHVRNTWSRAIVQAGYRPPSDLHGVKIDVCTSAAEAGAYIAKTQDGKSPGNEMARSDLKSGKSGHRTPLEILGEIADTGDLAELPLWHEYEKATKGHQAITWSMGLRELLLGVQPERTDEEIAAEEIGGDLVLEISREAWREVTRNLGLETRFLEAFERGGSTALLELAAGHGLALDPEPPGPVPRLILP
jgi:hypothetical protein